ncbi:MAG TPA: EAL domain-containing protein [Solirubrobacteraceae bacterium]|nr:EAL domain-containing protein [Solirubrobacteraceae bacterium]
MAAAETIAAVPAAVLAPERDETTRRRPLLAAVLAGTIVLGVLVATPLVAVADWGMAGEGELWALAGFVLLGELFPIRLPRSEQLDEITLSTPFAFALLLAYGPAPAIAAYAAASVVQDLFDRTAPAKTAFNAAQYALSIAAAAGVLALAGEPSPAGDGALPAILAAGLAMFAVNQALVGVLSALLTHRPAIRTLLDDLRFQAWTAGFQLTLGPIVFAVAERNLALVPLLFFPLLAIHVGGRQAVLNQHRAHHDELTELPNRRLFLQRLQEDVEDGAGAIAVLLDLDDFKSVNDTLGHQHGDELLVHVAHRLRASLPVDVTVARLGGDEFALLAGRQPGEPADLLARRAAEALEAPFELGGLLLDVRATMGLAVLPDHGATAEEVVKHADVALYTAKESRAPWALYAREGDDHSLDRLALAGQLRRGIERGELVVHYQPKLALRPGGRHGVEALVRWQHPQLGLIAPEGFIGLAEQSDLITRVTHRVLDDALEQCRRWRDDGLDLRVSVNLSARSLIDRDLAGLIGRLLDRWSLPSSALQVEITETRLVADVPRARTTLEQLRRLGVGVAIDDFGTGFSSLAQLTRLPVDEIKIDKSFVLGMESNRNDEAIVRSTIELGRNLHLQVTAEGVESREALDRLEALGCDFAQGFHVGRPVPAERCRRDLERFVRAGRAAATTLVVALALLALPGAALADHDDDSYDGTPYVVVFHSGVDALSATAKREQVLGFRARHRYRTALSGFSARLADWQVAVLRRDPNVAYVAPDILTRATGTTPLAAGETVPTGVARIGAAGGGLAQEPATAGVAVLDTGIDLKSPDLNAVAGVNCVSSLAAPQDDNGHGTHVAGTIAARNAGSGVVGVAPGTKLHAVKVLDKRKSGTLSMLLCGIDWVTRNGPGLGIRVVNMSIGAAGANDDACGSVNREALHQAICRSTAAGISYVVSAGNAKVALTKTVPAAYPEVLTVTAMSDSNGRSGGGGPSFSCKSGERDDQYATYSNWAASSTEAAHTIAAPGTCILSTRLGGGVATMYGTSSAAPHVAGVAALCCAGMAPADVTRTLRDRAAAVATAANGFQGDPLRPLSGRYYGHLVALP